MRTGPDAALRRRRVDRPYGTLDEALYAESLAVNYPYVSAMLAELPRKRAGSAPNVARIPHHCGTEKVRLAR